jgi:hypothetical protein
VVAPICTHIEKMHAYIDATFSLSISLFQGLLESGGKLVMLFEIIQQACLLGLSQISLLSESSCVQTRRCSCSRRAC